MEQLEIEVKFYIPLPENMKRRMIEMGAEPQGRVHERNVRYEDESNSLIRKKSLLRLRRSGKTVLTYKSSPSVVSTQFKVFKELEVEVSDFITMNQILGQLGLHPEQTYEKWRETYILDRTSLYLDTMPYGTFLEIEGSENNIRSCADRLALGWHKRILSNYLEIFEIIRQKLGLTFNDLTFKNFEGVTVHMAAFLFQLEAGHP